MKAHESAAVLMTEDVADEYKLSEMRALEVAGIRLANAQGDADAARETLKNDHVLALRMVEMDVVFLADRLGLVGVPEKISEAVKTVAERVETDGTWTVATLTNALAKLKAYVKKSPVQDYAYLDIAVRMCERDVKAHIHAVQILRALNELVA